MANFGQDNNFLMFNPLYNSGPYGDWPYPPYFYYPNQFNPNFYQEQSKVDESQNGSLEVKKEENEENNEIIQIPTNESQENFKKKETKTKRSKIRIEDANYMNKSQKSDRNLNSIVIRNFTNFVNGHPNLLKIVEMIIQKRKLKISSQQFKDLFRSRFPARQPYVGVGRLKKFIEIGKQHRDLRVITLTLLRKFISLDFFTVMLNSRKVSRSAKEKELKHGKKFWKEFSHQYLQQSPKQKN